MATIPNFDGLDTKFYLVPNGTVVTTVSNIETAIAAGKEIQNIVTFGDFDLGTYESLTKYNDWVIAIINHIEQRTTGLPIYVIL